MKNNSGTKKRKSVIIIVMLIVVFLLLIITAGIFLLKKRNMDRAGGNDTTSVSQKNDQKTDQKTDKIKDAVKGVDIEKNGTLSGVADENTVMIYMVASNLESEMGAASLDINEMIQSGVDTSKTNVVIFTGGASQWKSDVPSDKNYVLRLDGKGGLNIDGSTSDLENMGESGTLLGFLDFCGENYKADHYTLIFWDHGAGPVYGYGVDEVYHNDIMTYTEMSNAMAASPFSGKNKIDLVGFDACLMASIEYANLFSSYADYMVASQEIEPGLGWDYSFLSEYNSTSKPEKIADTILDKFSSFYDAHASMMSNPMYTLSCMDLSKTKDVTSAVDDLFGDMYKGLGDGDYSEIVQARDKTLNLGATAYGSKGDAIDQIDVGSIAEEFNGLYSGSSGSLDKALDKFIVRQASNVDGTSGISIYFPYSNQLFYQYYGDNMVEEISVGENYTTFVDAFATAWESDGENIADFYTDLEPTTEEPDTEEPTTEEPTTEEGSTEAPTEEPTEAPTETPTEEPTEAPTEQPTETPTEEGSTEETTESSGSTTEVISSQDTLTIKLTDKQKQNMASASYTIFKKNEMSDYDDAYVPIFANVKLEPDENGNLSVPKDPEVIVARAYDGECTVWPFKQVDVRVGNTEVYQSNGLYLISSMVDFPESANLMVVCNVAVKDGQTSILSFDAVGDDSISGKNDIEVEGWDSIAYYAPTYLPVKTADGKTIPYYDWDRDGVFYMSYVSLANGFTFETKKLSELEERFVCQVNIKDVKGNTHATDIVDFTRNPRTITTVDTPAGSMSCTVFNDYAIINSYEGSDKDIIIPSTVLDVPVTAIGADAFSRSEIESVEIPEGVITIGAETFNGCKKLSSVTIPSTIENIGIQCFGNCENLESISLPEGLKNIDTFAFYGCDLLADVTLPSTVEYYGAMALPSTANVSFAGNDTYVYENDALFTADKKTIVQCFTKEDSYDIPAGTEVVGTQAFRDLGINSVSIPEGVRLIDDSAFFGNELSADSLKFPESLEEIGDLAFGTFVLNDRKSVDKLTLGSKVKKIGKNAFNGYEIKSFDVSDGNENFSTLEGFLTNKNKDGLILAPYVSGKELKIPDGIVSVYTDDFMSLNRHSVTKLTLSDSVKTLNANSMYFIEELSIGKKLKSILDINMMNSIQKITVSKKNINFAMQDGVLYSGDMKELIIYPSGKTDKKFEIPEGVTKVGDSVFAENEHLEEITIPKSLKDISVKLTAQGGNAFSDTMALKKITVSKKNKYFSSKDGILYSKDGTSVLAVPIDKKGQIDIQKGALVIESGAISNLNKADAVVLPEGLTTVKSNNFLYLKADVHFPESCNYISSRTFSGPDSKKVTIYGKKGSEAERIANSKGMEFKEEK